MSRVRDLIEKGRIKPPLWLGDNLAYEVITGSVSYGVSSDTSDCDIIGFTIPPKDVVFPHLRGEIVGFGQPVKRFDQFQAHHVDGEGISGAATSYDLTVYGIVRFFQLCMENNPNMVDALFVPQRCVLTVTKVGLMVRDQRRLFLHKGAWHKFRGYAYSQLSKMEKSKPTGKRKALIEKHGMDTKFAYHVVRLLDECWQILEDGDLDLTRSREVLKAIRRGEWTAAKVRDYFESREKVMMDLYATSSLRHRPDEGAIKALLLACLEEHYGSLEGCPTNEGDAVSVLRRVLANLEQSAIDINRLI